MRFNFGVFGHPPNAVETVFKQRSILTEGGLVAIVRRTMEISGKLHADTPSELTTQIEQTNQTYQQSGVDAILFEDDNVPGQTPTAHKLINAESLNGVHVVQPPTYSPGGHAEYTTFRSFSVILEADFPGETNGIESLEETLTYTGTGGPRFVHLQTMTGFPRKQQVAERTTVKLIQSGRIIGLLNRVPPPPPLFPDLEIQQARTLTKSGPFAGPGFKRTRYITSYSYQFEMLAAFNREPRIGI